MPVAQSNLAKLTRPRLHKSVLRERLFQVLDEACRRPVLWVAGPPGAGKTTLVASYLESRKRRIFWFQVDESDRDPATFFLYLGQLAQTTRRGKGAMPYLTPDHLPDLKGFARRFWRELFHRLGQDAVLVLDNCQDAEGEAFHTILREGFAEIPAGVTVIGISRSRLAPEFSRLAANQVIAEVDSSDLRLTEAEASQIASYAGIADDAKVSRLYRASAGWTAGLVLLLARKGDHVAEHGVAHESKEALFNYLAEEVYRQMDARTQSILIRTALLPRISAAMAAELCADPDAASVLEELYRKQYFVRSR